MGSRNYRLILYPLIGFLAYNSGIISKLIVSTETKAHLGLDYRKIAKKPRLHKIEKSPLLAVSKTVMRFKSICPSWTTNTVFTETV